MWGRRCCTRGWPSRCLVSNTPTVFPRSCPGQIGPITCSTMFFRHTKRPAPTPGGARARVGASLEAMQSPRSAAPPGGGASPWRRPGVAPPADLRARLVLRHCMPLQRMAWQYGAAPPCTVSHRAAPCHAIQRLTLLRSFPRLSTVQQQLHTIMTEYMHISFSFEDARNPPRRQHVNIAQFHNKYVHRGAHALLNSLIQGVRRRLRVRTPSSPPRGRGRSPAASPRAQCNTERPMPCATKAWTHYAHAVHHVTPTSAALPAMTLQSNCSSATGYIATLRMQNKSASNTSNYIPISTRYILHTTCVPRGPPSVHRHAYMLESLYDGLRKRTCAVPSSTSTSKDVCTSPYVYMSGS